MSIGSFDIKKWFNNMEKYLVCTASEPCFGELWHTVLVDITIYVFHW
jgi:hypothetical protein